MTIVAKIIVSLFLCVVPFASMASNNTSKGPLSPDDIKRVESYLNAITTFKADFLQISPSGDVSTGIFYLSRPGKLRWQYSPPVPILIVANGSLITYYDKELKEVSYVPSNSSLAAFLTRKTIRFSDDVEIVKTNKSAGLLRISIIQKGKKQEGKLTLICSNQPLMLKKIEVIDVSGQLTTVTLNNVKYGIQLDKDLFILQNLPLYKGSKD